MDRLGLTCRTILEEPRITQRGLAQKLGISLGAANMLLKESIESELIRALNGPVNNYEVTEKGLRYLKPFRVDGAVILAAGFGSRFVPLTYETPKGLLEVHGERMIERQIKQLHEVGIFHITIVVGYLKEKFEYLIDKYEISLLYNPEYASKNTLATVYHARHLFYGRNMYLLSSDNWMRSNMFHSYECGPWYSSVYMEGRTSEWVLDFTKRGLITEVRIGGKDRWVMYGPVFFSKEFSGSFLPRLEAYYDAPGNESFFWEQVYMENTSQFQLYINQRPKDEVYEFENLEELRQFDPKYQTSSNNKVLELIANVFQRSESDIRNIRCLKAGMTNKSFLFDLDGKRYICRVPGPGTDLLINRRQEETVYQTVRSLGITEKIIYMNGESGYKIAEFYGGARNADASDWDDMARCMAALRTLHESRLEVPHSFDIRERISFYIALSQGNSKVPFEDFDMVFNWMLHLLNWLDRQNRPKVLTHIDGVADNFLFLEDGTLCLIDWEYSGMCDPFIDVAMSAIYSYYDETGVDRLFELYLGSEPDVTERMILYSYVALGGFLWSLWAVYKSSLGDEFGEYTIHMYRYAKQYYRKVWDLGLNGS